MCVNMHWIELWMYSICICLYFEGQYSMYLKMLNVSHLAPTKIWNQHKMLI